MVCRTRNMLDKAVIFVCLHLALAYFQNDYLIKYERHTDLYLNKDFWKNYAFNFDYINRTTRVINANGTLIKPMSTHLKFKLQTYKFLSNEYRYFPVFYEDNPCLAIASDIFGNSVAKFDSNIKKCPFLPGFYYIRNIIYDQSKFPPYAPRGRYMLELKVLEREILLMGAKIYVNIVPTNPLEIIPY